MSPITSICNHYELPQPFTLPYQGDYQGNLFYIAISPSIASIKAGSLSSPGFTEIHCGIKADKKNLFFFMDGGMHLFPLLKPQVQLSALLLSFGKPAFISLTFGC